MVPVDDAGCSGWFDEEVVGARVGMHQGLALQCSLGAQAQGREVGKALPSRGGRSLGQARVPPAVEGLQRLDIAPEVGRQRAGRHRRCDP
jgi:hypothetical protein